MFCRNNLKLVALVSCVVALSGCIGSDKEVTKNAASSGAPLSNIDITAPAITINGDWLTTIELGSDYLEEGASAIDNADGSVSVSQSGSVDTSVLGIYRITYSATDAAGNTGAVVREVHVADTIAPIMTLAGSPVIEIYRGDVFLEPEGTTAVDSVEGVVEVEIDGTLDNTKSGVYTLTYSASDSSGNTVSKTRTITVLYRPILNIQSKNFVTGNAIGGVDVSISLTENNIHSIRTAQTDSNGHLIVILADDVRDIIVSGDADGYGEFSKKVLVVDQNVDMFLQPVNAEITFIPTALTELEVSDLSIITLAANSLINENDVLASGNLSAELTVIDPSVDPDLMSGNFETIDGGTVGHIESFGAVNVTIDNTAGNSFNLAAGQTATIRIPLASASLTAVDAPPSTLFLYYFDKETGYWVKGNTATLITENGHSYYEGSVSSMGTWTAGVLYPSVLINGCARNSFGGPVNLAEVQTQGVTFFGQTLTVTDIAGDFSIAAKANSTVLLSLSTSRSASRTETIETVTDDIDLAECIVLENSAIVITLTWGQNPSDLDTQFFGPNAETGNTAFLVSYLNKEQIINQSTISLDVDDTTSFGPEITTISSFPYAGRYSYAINHFAGTSNISASPARVELNYEGERFIFSPPEGTASKCWGVLDFVVDDEGEIRIEKVGQWKSNAYCVANEFIRL